MLPLFTDIYATKSLYSMVAKQLSGSCMHHNYKSLKVWKKKTLNQIVSMRNGWWERRRGRTTFYVLKIYLNYSQFIKLPPGGHFCCVDITMHGVSWHCCKLSFFSVTWSKLAAGGRICHCVGVCV